MTDEYPSESRNYLKEGKTRNKIEVETPLEINYAKSPGLGLSTYKCQELPRHKVYSSILNPNTLPALQFSFSNSQSSFSPSAILLPFITSFGLFYSPFATTFIFLLFVVKEFLVLSEEQCTSIF